jgi:hypothetical protein
VDPPSLRIDLSDFPTPKGAGRTGKKRDGRDPGPKGILFRCVRWSALLLVLGALPFFTLLRVSVFLSKEHGVDSWLALVGTADHLHVFIMSAG